MQTGLFDTPPAVEIPPPPIALRRTGRDLAEEGAQVAMDKAQKDTGDAFRDAALRFFVTYAMNHFEHGKPVGVAEARLASKGIVPAVKNARAWGQIPKLAEKEGYVTFAGHGASTDPKSHSTPRGLWLWTGKTL